MPGTRHLTLLVAVLVGLALVALAVQCLVLLLSTAPVAHGAWRVGVSAVVVTGVWFLLNGPLEGPTVLVFSSNHGLTVGDLAGVPPLLLGGVVAALALPAPA
ncbi:hypothetical protein SAMN06264364_12944 [Quadrisphaera granulorum]|uniref:Uncharacterized protein n=1 Tax=Quadrisphaera granulorum TaxID=317664 RepID=A0A315ZU06_9ACTN|nr:hypothetical protein [Quadrisphaera granulorum]PWJ48663.1 hypothetical protein BXY45_12944 [Quadrisphaera granulorum]SZE98385.1 hypothetical protein SAMN06264364_12944 [Quadrisphaera granulorum]